MPIQSDRKTVALIRQIRLLLPENERSCVRYSDPQILLVLRGIFFDSTDPVLDSCILELFEHIEAPTPIRVNFKKQLGSHRVKDLVA